MLLLSRVAGHMLGLRGPDLAWGPEVAHCWASCYFVVMIQSER